MKHLDLFSGIGGFALAAQRVGWETIGFCEIEPYAQKVLKKHWPDVPIYEDIRTLDAGTVGHVDIITGGYPCQPFSLSGQRRGEADDRHLWPEFARLIRELRPSWAIGENVAGHISMGLDNVLSDLEGLGYTAEAFVIPAVAVDARHRRDRVWVTAHANGSQCERGGVPGRVQEKHADTGDPCRWPDEPGVDRVANGIPNRVDRLKGLGNAIVPKVAEAIFRSINKIGVNHGGDIQMEDR